MAQFFSLHPEQPQPRLIRQAVEILRARGDQTVLCSVVDLPPDREKALNLALNRTGGDFAEHFVDGRA